MTTNPTGNDRHHVYDEEDGVHRIAGLTSQPATYQEPDQPSYDKTWPDPDTQRHTVVPGSTTPAAVSQLGVDLSVAPPAPVEDVAIPLTDVPGHAASVGTATTAPADSGHTGLEEGLQAPIGGRELEPGQAGEPLTEEQPTQPDGTPIPTPDAAAATETDLAPGETPVEPPTTGEPTGATTTEGTETQ